MSNKRPRNPRSLPQRRHWLFGEGLWNLPRLPVLALLACALPSFAQQSYDPDAVLLSVRDRLLPELERLPRYTCVQTITRRYYRPEPPGLRPSCAELIAAHDKRKHELTLLSWDRLRMEVAIADGQNVYSWVGAPKFEEGTIEKLASGGPLGSGDFGPFLRSILLRASVSFQEEQAAENKRLLLYSYQMPLSRSSYQVKGDKGWVPTGYGGTFLLDPFDSDIVALKIRSDELKENKAVCQANSEIDYSRFTIHDRAVLIPSETRLRIIAPDGGESLSTTDYSQCREYASKTRLFFDAPQDRLVTPAAHNSTTTDRLPAGLHFVGRIITPVDSETAAAGDPIEVVLRKPLRGANNVLIAPTGATLHARLNRVKHWLGGFTQITLQFETMELNGTTVPLRARADAAPPPMSRGPGNILVSRDPESLDTTSITIRGDHLRFQQFDWGWTTLSPNPEDDRPF